MSHPVNWFQIGGPDGKALEAFYKKVFAWKMSPSPDGSPMAMVTPEPPSGIPGSVGTSQNGQPSVAVYVSVPSVDKHLAKIEAAGGRLAMPRMELPGGMGAIAGFIDPGGNWIGLWEPGKGAAAPRETAPKRTAKKTAKRSAKKVAKKAAPKKAAPKKPARKKAPKNS